MKITTIILIFFISKARSASINSITGEGPRVTIIVNQEQFDKLNEVHDVAPTVQEAVEELIKEPVEELIEEHVKEVVTEAPVAKEEPGFLQKITF